MNTTPLYRHNATYAREHNELETYRASMKASISCKEAIETAIRTHFDGMHLDESAVSEVMESFGKERISYVLANTVQQKEWDGRFSRGNKKWAQQFEIEGAMKPEYDSRYQFVVESHPAVLDGFISAFREEYAVEQPRQQEKPSIMEVMKTTRLQDKPLTPLKATKPTEIEL